MRLRCATSLAVIFAMVGCRGDMNARTSAPAAASSIGVDTVWSSTPSNTDLNQSFGAIERGDRILFENHPQNTYLPVLDRKGNTVRKVGGPGDASGKYSSIQMIAAHPTGQIYVFDRQRFTVLDSMFAVVRTVDLPLKVERAVVLSDEHIVVTGDGAPNRTDFALHLLDGNGKIVRSFDPVDRSAYYSRFIALGRSNTILSHDYESETPTYHIKRWDPRSGQVIQLIQSAPEWFHQAAPDTLIVEGRLRVRSAPVPRILDMLETSNGILWVLSSMPDARWPTAPPSSWDMRLDGVLEARNAETGALLAFRVFDQYLTSFTANGRVIALSSQGNGPLLHVLLELSLRPD